jgi:uncharacterized protein with ATP-grasp and redox domains
MPVSLDCVICLTRQSLEAARFATSEEVRHTAVLKRAFDLVLEKGFTTIPPLVAQEIQRIIRRETGNPDPYSVQKSESNMLMLSVRESLREKIRNSSDPFRSAMQLAIAGNTIDYAVRGDWNKELLLDAIESAMRQPVNGDVEQFTDAVAQSRKLLYLLDNCGEIICDQILIEEIKRFNPAMTITAVVRGAPVLNDVTSDDAKQIGLDQIVNVIDNGNDGVGTILEQCSEEFHRAFQESDTIIAKGLANYETLVEYRAQTLPHTVCYLFKAKCSFIAQYAGVTLGDLVVRTTCKNI